MQTVTLAYRDHDRTPTIFCIKEMAARHYNLDVRVAHIPGGAEYEAALFNGQTDVIIERLEYLYAEINRGRRLCMFAAPVIITQLELVVPPRVNSLDDLRGKKIAVRSTGRPEQVKLRLRKLGILDDVETVIVNDEDVGRWGTWKPVASGECAGAFITDLYLHQALAGGLKILPTEELETVGLFSQATTSQFANGRPEEMEAYVKATIHALCLMKHQRSAALEIAGGEPMRRMKIDDRAELERQFDSIVKAMNVKPYPTADAIATHYEVSLGEWPDGKGLNPLAAWDMHWVKKLDDEGFVDGLLDSMKRSQ